MLFKKIKLNITKQLSCDETKALHYFFINNCYHKPYVDITNCKMKVIEDIIINNELNISLVSSDDTIIKLVKKMHDITVYKNIVFEINEISNIIKSLNENPNPIFDFREINEGFVKQVIESEIIKNGLSKELSSFDNPISNLFVKVDNNFDVTFGDFRILNIESDEKLDDFNKLNKYSKEYLVGENICKNCSSFLFCKPNPILSYKDYCGQINIVDDLTCTLFKSIKLELNNDVEEDYKNEIITQVVDALGVISKSLDSLTNTVCANTIFIDELSKSLENFVEATNGESK